ncbi:RHS repeat protein [Flagellimonas allohymeniacidonis]|uniref:YD repeat-containing protein n=1 Tax=Flagellimonas allohymeniacidonis TaxID=2517819 RepID=A0A4Q8QDE2_9FLAO|nr:RHS repeat domain-containing protein [Allomuricauda hymeniacidonis]TAI48482.1 hypothetical protein EW142_01370 [Allomuricauda hymeniacidonis]
MTKKILLALCLLSIHFMYAQGTPPETDYELPRIIPPAPDVQQMEKYGEIPVGYYTGTPNISIDLYAVPTRSDLSVPISLSYHPSGVRVDEKASRVGLGWSLNAEGVISRSVAGIKEFTVSPGTARPDVGTFDPNDYANRIADYNYAVDVVAGDEDSEPDVFQYNFMGRSGKFIFDESGDIHLIPKEAFSITTNPLMTQFTIVDEMGNTFLFTAQGMSVVGSNCSQGGASNYLGNNVSTSWKLTQITTHTGEVIDFLYRTFTYQYILAKEATDYHPISLPFGCSTKAPENCEKTITHTERVLDRINFSSGNVQFTYSDDPSYPINGSNTRTDFSGNHALRKVAISNSSGVVKTFELVYDYFGPTGTSTEDDNRLKLTELIEVNSEKKHRFTYNESVNLPPRFSYSQDLWGFYNGKSNTTILPETYHAGTLIAGADRSVSTTHSQAGVLTKITYPTQGTSEFFYESNDYYEDQTTTEYVPGGFTRYADFGPPYDNTHAFTIQSSYQNINLNILNQCGNPPSQIVLQDGALAKILDSNNQEVGRYVSSDDHALTLSPGNYTLEFEVDGSACMFRARFSWYEEQTVPAQNKLTGGLRIQKIRNYDGVDYEERTYSYNKAGSTQSSGYLQGIPQFHYVVYQQNQSNSNICTYLGRGHSSIYPLATALGNSVGYSRVTEINNSEAGNGKTVYHFTNDIDTYNGTGLKFPNIPPTSYSWKRGLLLKKEMMNSAGSKVQEEINTYAFDTQFVGNSSENYGGDKLSAGFVIRQVQAEFFPTNATFAWDHYYITSAWVKPVSKQTISYFPNQVTRTENYYYDNPTHQQRTRMETTDSQGLAQQQRWYYPDDIQTTSSLPGGNLTGPDSIVIGKLKKNGTHPKIGEIIQTNQKTGGSEMMTRKLYEVYGPNVLPKSLNSKKDGTDMESRIVYHDYDDQGNIIEVGLENGTPISYIWGYNNMYPVAKIENATFSQIELLSGFGSGFDLGSGGLNSTQLNSLRSSSLSEAMVTTMTYDPLVGLTSITDPRGYTTTYHYDSFNRLSEIKDQDGNIVSHYQYNYKNQ